MEEFMENKCTAADALAGACNYLLLVLILKIFAQVESLLAQARQ